MSKTLAETSVGYEFLFSPHSTDSTE